MLQRREFRRPKGDRKRNSNGQFFAYFGVTFGNLFWSTLTTFIVHFVLRIPLAEIIFQRSQGVSKKKYRKFIKIVTSKSSILGASNRIVLTQMPLLNTSLYDSLSQTRSEHSSRSLWMPKTHRFTNKLFLRTLFAEITFQTAFLRHYFQIHS